MKQLEAMEKDLAGSQDSEGGGGGGVVESVETTPTTTPASSNEGPPFGLAPLSLDGKLKGVVVNRGGGYGWKFEF